MSEEVKVNSLKAWVLASRPKTLAAAVAPVLVGGALGFCCCAGGCEDLANFHVSRFVLCLLFAILMQIDANLINDLYDFLKGTDGEDRLGPKRAMAQGWITKKAMYVGIVAVTLLACLSGLVMLYDLYISLPVSHEAVSLDIWNQEQYEVFIHLLLVGVFSVLFAYSYTSGPFPLSYHGLGDVAVVVFFGHIAVFYTAYVSVYTVGVSQSIPLFVGVAVGMVVDTLLIVNNYRDRDTDKRDGKNTLIARFGEKFGRLFYLYIGLGAVLVMSSGLILYAEDKLMKSIIPVAYIPYIMVHFRNYAEMKRIKEGSALNVLIGKSSMAMLLFAVITVLLLSLGSFSFQHSSI